MRTIRSLVHKLTTPICQRKGFVNASILLDWTEIVGREFQKFCEPEKVVFPFQKKSLGTLYIRTPSHMAIEIAYLEPIILERINAYYGYQAIARLSISQGPLLRKDTINNPEVTLSENCHNTIESIIINVKDDEIKNALRDLGEGIWKKVNK